MKTPLIAVSAVILLSGCYNTEVKCWRNGKLVQHFLAQGWPATEYAGEGYEQLPNGEVIQARCVSKYPYRGPRTLPRMERTD